MNFSPSLMRLAKIILAIDAVIILTAITLDLGYGTDHFGEKGMVTILSTMLLLLCGWFSYCVFKLRFTGGQSWNVSATLWAAIALGCIFLAADEFFRIHERLDEQIHVLLNIQETAVTDRLDDMLIAIYMLGALAIIACYRNEIRSFASLWTWMAVGFGMASLMVMLDALTNREDILPLFLDGATARIVHLGICGMEDSLKILAESVFAVMFFRAREIASLLADLDYGNG